MKANRKFLENESAVSPVIAVILMVAITVVLAATVYVWVSGFGQNGSQAKNLSATQAAATNFGAANGTVSFTIVSVSPNFDCSALKITSTDGKTWLYDTSIATTSGYYLTKNGVACSSGAKLAAGDIIKLNWKDDAVGAAENFGPASTASLNWIDLASNNVVATITLHP